jgi:hypothetical protein
MKKRSPNMTRYLLYKQAETLDEGDALLFPLRPGETVRVARNRIRSRLNHDRRFTYRVLLADDGVQVIKAGRRENLFEISAPQSWRGPRK